MYLFILLPASLTCFCSYMFQAKTYLEKAMKLDPTYLEAVYIMADIHDQQQHYDKGIEL